MKFKFGVTTFALSQIKSERIVLREPDFSSITASMEKYKRNQMVKEMLLVGSFVVATIALALTISSKQT